MYETHWNLSHKPFAYRVAPASLYRSATLQSAHLRLRYCIENNAGAALLVGSSGVGKSSLLQLLRMDSSDLTPFVHVTYATLAPQELLRVIAGELLGDDLADNHSFDAMLAAVRDGIRRHSEQGTHTVIALDESHLLTQDALNQVVLPLLNFADTDTDLQLSVFLCGQPVLTSHVSRNAQLRERIAVTATLGGFRDDETADYIHSRMSAAGADRQVFCDDAVAAIVELSGGNPRRVNRLCDMALLVGCADQSQHVSADDIRSLSVELLPAAA